MEMHVDAQLIRNERLKRAWSQERPSVQTKDGTPAMFRVGGDDGMMLELLITPTIE